MFDIKCVYCKNFNPKDGCLMSLEEDSCNAFEEAIKSQNVEDKPSCESCAWQTNGYCDFDLENPLTCRRFKSLNEDL
ncbi:MAG: hypothetical protein IKA99_04970 [Clostridia bacterium]|nr:hypothetical protein [Clostridia bacterium]